MLESVGLFRCEYDDILTQLPSAASKFRVPAVRVSEGTIPLSVQRPLLFRVELSRNGLTFT
jgi:hypothetical protein